MTLQEVTWLITVISFVGGIAIFLFKKIVIEPLQKSMSTSNEQLQKSINALNDTLKEFRLSTNKQLEIHDKEIDLLKIKTARQDEQIKPLFGKKENV